MPTELETQFSELIGVRVSIRLHEPEGGFRDILGHLVTPYSLRKKNGEIIFSDTGHNAGLEVAGLIGELMMG